MEYIFSNKEDYIFFKDILKEEIKQLDEKLYIYRCCFKVLDEKIKQL